MHIMNINDIIVQLQKSHGLFFFFFCVCNFKKTYYHSMRILITFSWLALLKSSLTWLKYWVDLFNFIASYMASWVFANGPWNQGSIPGRVIPKTEKMVLDATLLNTQHYKVRIKGKMEQFREWSSTLPYTLV